jgi:hypothetical protein
MICSFILCGFVVYINFFDYIEEDYQDYTYNYTKDTPIGPYRINFYLDITKYGYRLGVYISLHLKLPNFDYSQIPFIEK